MMQQSLISEIKAKSKTVFKTALFP